MRFSQATGLDEDSSWLEGTLENPWIDQEAGVVGGVGGHVYRVTGRKVGRFESSEPNKNIRQEFKGWKVSKFAGWLRGRL